MTVPTPDTAPAIRWGFIGSGWIAEQFANGINQHTKSSIIAVGSRSLERAQAFAAQHHVARAYGSYEELVADPDVDVVYVASPHSHHREHALLALAAGKPVLVEKAFTRNAAEAAEVIDFARQQQLFCMEAMWTRFLPHVHEIKETIARGEIGEVISIQASHDQSFAFDPEHRLFNPALAGGALLDLGVYPLSFSWDILGAPTSVHAVGHLAETGVDQQVSMILQYPNAQATLHTNMQAITSNTALIAGTLGRIELGAWFYTPTTWKVVRKDGVTYSGGTSVSNGYAYEAAEVARLVTSGKLESDRMPLSETLAIMAAMDQIRAQVGVVYPGE